MRARLLPLLVALVLLANADPAGARDFLIRPLEIPAGVDPFDSGNWIDTDVTPDGRLYVGYAQEVENSANPYQTVYVGPDGAAVVDESAARLFGFVNVDATPSGWLGMGYQAGVTGFLGDLFRTALPPQWEPIVQTLPVTDGNAATHIAVDRADAYQQVAYFDGDPSNAGVADLRWARPAFPEYVSEFVDQVYVRHGRGRQIDIQVDQFDEPRIAYFGSDHSLNYAYRSGSTWVVEDVTVMFGQGLGHVDLALDGAGRPHVSFYYIDSQDLMYAVRDYDGTWSVDLAAFNGRVGKWSSIAIDPAGVPHISAYRSSDRNVVVVTPAPGDTWDAEVIDPYGGVGESNSIGIDAYGGIHVVYRGRGNGRPLHAWWMDWNVNGVHDATDIANGLLTDCDGDEIPDEAELLFGFAQDCNQNGIPDECEQDCDGDGTLDACQIAADPSLDCDDDGVLDACQVAAETGLDCDGDGLLDTCQLADGTAADCDGNGVLDSCQLATGSNDCNANGLLDLCEVQAGPTVDGTGGFLQPDQRAGERIATGDLNGDGHPDVVYTERDEVKVLLGGSGFDAVSDFDIDVRSDAIFVGDVNGDGLDDVAVTRFTVTFERSRFILYRGDAAAVLVQDRTVESPADDVDFGAAMALADVDGDGVEELVVGAPGGDGFSSGDPFVVVLSPDALDGAPEQTWTAPGPNADDFGRTLVNAGDLDGNGLDDVVVGDPGGVGQAIVHFSRPDGPSVVGPVMNPDYSLKGFASSFAPLGDINGDGFDDLLVGDPQYFLSDGASGRLMLYHGGNPMNGHHDVVFWERTFGTRVGASMASGDLDGDGFDDVLVGSTGISGLGDRGVVEVHFGGPHLDTTVDLRLPDVVAAGGVGTSVAILGDVDDDGIAEFAYGAPREENDGRLRIASLVMPDFSDCDGNGVRDACDIAGGAADGDGNGVPDVCELPTHAPPAERPRISRIVGAHPTPFNPRTTLVFDVAAAGPVEVVVYDAAGRKVDTVLREHVDAGRHQVTWSARSGTSQLASGVYYAVLRTGAERSVQKVVLVR